MKIRERIRLEKEKLPLMCKGHSRTMANAWVRATLRDQRNHKRFYDPTTIQKAHKQGYLASSIERYDLFGTPVLDYISDFDYISLNPFNNSFSKWLDDILTTNRILKNHATHCRSLYFSIIRRNGKQLLLRVNHEDREYLPDDLLDTVRENGPLELRPAFWGSTKSRYTLEYRGDDLYVNGEPMTTQMFNRSILAPLSSNYVLAEKISLQYTFSHAKILDHSLKFWISNDCADTPKLLFASMSLYWNEGAHKHREHITVPFDTETGSFEFENERVTIRNWSETKQQLLSISETLKPISYYTCTIALQNDGPFKLLHFSASPLLPEIAFDSVLNDYLKERVARRKSLPNPTLKARWTSLKTILFAKLVRKFCRPGIRPYMQRLWMNSVKSDFLHTKNVSLPQKIWCWKRGFLSYRTYQYGLTKDNYKIFLSDYDYHYLNRINNDYQKWINDKTTTRYILDPFSMHIPNYYFLIFNRNGKAEFFRMWDCPEEITPTPDGLFTLLRTKKRLALKPSAGTHGDGFYCLSYEDGNYTVNGKVHTEEQITDLLAHFKSFYLITEYIDMHSNLKAIYPKSVNTVRMMVINPNGYDPKIMQTYMRIGSSKTGFTDNVGYGGICVMVDRETGELYQPETISDHKFYDCPNHPDTGTPISGFLPNWDLVCERVKEISRYLCELEYLGFDIAITEEGFHLLEINIHQDLHKVAMYDEEIRTFFREKIAHKNALYHR